MSIGHRIVPRGISVLKAGKIVQPDIMYRYNGIQRTTPPYGASTRLPIALPYRAEVTLFSPSQETNTQHSRETQMERESAEFDVLIVRRRPCGLAAAIRLNATGSRERAGFLHLPDRKAAEIGAHILSGAVIDPAPSTNSSPTGKRWAHALNTPGHRRPGDLPVRSRRQAGSQRPAPRRLPQRRQLYIVRLGNLAKWLGEQAEAMGIEVYPGFSGAQLLFDDKRRWPA